jgi:alanyl-tRNA synthetase
MLQDGVVPSNKEQGYILRRALRRAMRFAKVLNINEPILPLVAIEFINTYKSVYPTLEEKQKFIIDEIQKEEEKFTKTLERGRKELTKKIPKIIEDFKLGELQSVVSIISNIEQTNGYPTDFIIEDLMQFDSLEINDKVVEELKELLKKETEKHKALSRSGAEKRFKGGLADTKETTVRYHSCAHLLLKALQLIVSKDIHQKGQNITDERLRYDFNFDKPLTREELSKVEAQVNDWINLDLIVSIDTVNKSELEKLGAEASFLDRYPEIVSVYKFSNTNDNEVISYEVCGGPHVENTKDILKSGKFKITKEQSSSSGVRRIRAELV